MDATKEGLILPTEQRGLDNNNYALLLCLYMQPKVAIMHSTLSAAVSKYKRKPIVLPSNSAPNNWRMRVEVELEVHGPSEGSLDTMPDMLVQGQGPLAPRNTFQVPPADSDLRSPDTPPLTPGSPVPGQQQPGGPDSVLSSTHPSAQQVPPTPPSTPLTSSGGAAGIPPPLSSTGGSASPPVGVPATAGIASSAASASSAAAAGPTSMGRSGPGSGPSFPPLHPEIAEILPALRIKPETLTPDVASMLVTYAMSAGGRLHPDVASALSDALAAGAKLHPEVVELLQPNGLHDDGALHSDEE